MTVPSVDLSGDNPAAPLFADVLHCESIALRCRLHDWSFVAHRHARLHQFFWITRGGGRAVLDGAPQGFGSNTLALVPAMAVHGFQFSPGTSGWVVTLPAGHAAPVPETPFLLKVTGTADPTIVTGLFAQIAEEHGAARPARAEMLGALATSLAVWAFRAAGARAAPPLAPGPAPGPARRLVRRFAALVEENFRAQWPVEAYAAALAITPTHLTRVCRALLGQTAIALIHERLMLEARRELAFSDRQVAAIAFGLGFHDPAWFTRLFTQKVGEAPTAFRRRSRGPAPAPARPAPIRPSLPRP